MNEIVKAELLSLGGEMQGPAFYLSKCLLDGA
jgi:hypothetical protein